MTSHLFAEKNITHFVCNARGQNHFFPPLDFLPLNRVPNADTGPPPRPPK